MHSSEACVYDDRVKHHQRRGSIRREAGLKPTRSSDPATLSFSGFRIVTLDRWVTRRLRFQDHLRLAAGIGSDAVRCLALWHLVVASGNRHDGACSSTSELVKPLCVRPHSTAS